MRISVLLTVIICIYADSPIYVALLDWGLPMRTTAIRVPRQSEDTQFTHCVVYILSHSIFNSCKSTRIT